MYKRIGHPSIDQEECRARDVMAPSLFAMPSKSNYDTITGFGKPAVVIKTHSSIVTMRLKRVVVFLLFSIWQHTLLVHCSVARVDKNKYHLTFQAEDAETVSMIAVKVKSSRTSNYHIFDAVRGGINAKLSKKAGHYIGKIRRDKGQPVGCYTLYNSSREKEQTAAYLYDVPKVVKKVTEGQPPRKMQAVIPKDMGRGGVGKVGSLLEHLHSGTWKNHGLLALCTRSPTFQDGHYRLNFSGRVLEPSVKNMQLEASGEVLLQFGKVDEDTFHLDYKASI